jgi:hypothetical protein
MMKNGFIRGGGLIFRRVSGCFRPFLFRFAAWCLTAFLTASLLTGCAEPAGEIDELDLVIEKYQVKIPPIGHGSITPNITRAVVGEIVTLLVTADEDYRLKADSLRVNGEPSLPQGGGTYYTFPMPVGDATVTAVFEPIGEHELKYDIRIDPDVVKGAITANPWHAAEGAHIELSPEPEPGYRLAAGTLGAAREDGGEVPVQGNSFTMPAADVTVWAVFEPIPHDAPMYKITLNQVGSGTINADRVEAAEGEQVLVTVNPADFQRLQSILVKDYVTVLTSLGPKTYAFTMPACDVEIWAHFEPLSLVYNIGGTISTNDGGSAEKAELNLTASDGHIQSQTRAGTGGLYLISQVSPGIYTLRVDLYGYEPRVIGPFEVEGNLSGLDLTLEKVVLTYAVSGTITSSGGGSISGAKVQLKQGASSLAGETATSADGAYLISGVSPGEHYVVEASLAGYQSGQTTEFTVAGADVGGMNLTLQKLYRVEGRVSTADGGSLANAHVRLKREGGTLAKPVPVGSGAFTVDKVSPGTYTVEASLFNYDTVAESFILSDADVSGINLVLEKAVQTFTISGTVFKSQGSVTSPAENATVRLKKDDVLLQTLTTASGGGYTFSGAIADHTYTLEAELSGYQANSISFRLNGDTTKNLTLTQLAAFTGLSQLNGAQGTATTTALTLSFDKALSGLTADHVTLGPVSGSSALAVKAGGLQQQGTSGAYTLPVTVTAGGDIQVSVSPPPGYVISGGPRNVGVYYSAPVVPAVTKVTIDPKTAVLFAGGGTQFSAIVSVSGGASNSVTWSISGNSSADTTFNSSTRTLTVGNDEAARTISVTAVSGFDPTKSDTAAVAVCIPKNFEGEWKNSSKTLTLTITNTGISCSALGQAWKIGKSGSGGTYYIQTPANNPPQSVPADYPIGYILRDYVTDVGNISPAPEKYRSFEFELYMAKDGRSIYWYCVSMPNYSGVYYKE